jgi:hypothetical protein
MTENLRKFLGQEADEAEAYADAEEQGEVAPQSGQRGRKRSKDPSQVYAVRIPVSRLNEIKAIADRLDEAPSVLIRKWVLERLDELRREEEAHSTTRSDSEPNVTAGHIHLGPRRQTTVREASGEVRSRRRRYA